MICPTTKALHIEAVTDLTTKALLADPSQLISTQTKVPPFTALNEYSTKRGC